MKHLFTALFILMASVTTMYGQTVSPSDAQQKASAFLSKHTAGAKGGAAAELQLAYTAQEGDETYYYVFNHSGGGFVIVGGDEAARTILGYVDHGTFDYATAPENVKWWLGQYRQQISNAIKGVKQGTISLSQNAGAKGVNAIARANIAPLVTTEWDQVAPYNTAIPKIAGNSYTTNGALATGCVATAAAQIMKYHNYPTKGTGSNSYTQSWNSGAITLTFEANFGETTYQWNKMENSYTYNTYGGDGPGTGTEAENAVATLIYHCGVAANMKYGQLSGKGSSASTAVLGQGMISYFGYDKGMSLEERALYSDDDWAEMIYAELASDRPVIYSGSTGSAGHAFICDGYKYEGGYDLYHMNWGWNGNCNGFFPLQGTANGVKALTPDGTGSGGGSAGSSYDQDQDVLIGIQPNKGGALKLKMKCNAFTISSSASAGASASFSGTFFNTSLQTTDLTWGIQLVNQSTDDVTNIEVETWDDVAYNEGFSTNSAITIPVSQAPGAYTAYPAYKDENGAWQKMASSLSMPTLTVNAAGEGLIVNGTPTVSNGGYVTSNSGTFTVTVWNNSSSALENASFRAWVYSINGLSLTGIGLIDVTENFAAGETKDVVFDIAQYNYAWVTNGAPMANGNNYSIAAQYNGKKITDYISMTCTAPQTIDYKLSSAGWGTLCLPFSAEKPAGLTLYEVNDVAGSTLTKSEATEIAMNKAYLVSGTAGTYSFTGPTTPTGQYQNGLLVGNTTSEAVYVPKDCYVMQNLAATGLAFYKVAEDDSQRCSPYKAYLKVPAALSYLYSSLLFTDSTTGITSTTDAETQKQSVRKTVKDGRIVIVTPNGTFTTAGTMIK